MWGFTSERRGRSGLSPKEWKEREGRRKQKRAVPDAGSRASKQKVTVKPSLTHKRMRESTVDTGASEHVIKRQRMGEDAGPSKKCKKSVTFRFRVNVETDDC